MPRHPFKIDHRRELASRVHNYWVFQIVREETFAILEKPAHTWKLKVSLSVTKERPYTLVIQLQYWRDYPIEVDDEVLGDEDGYIDLPDYVDLSGGTYRILPDDTPEMFSANRSLDYYLQVRDLARSILTVARRKLETDPQGEATFTYRGGEWVRDLSQQPVEPEPVEPVRPTLMEHLLGD